LQEASAAAARSLGVVDQTLFNWVQAQREGKLTGVDSSKAVSVELMAISRLRAEPARVKMERDSLHRDSPTVAFFEHRAAGGRFLGS